MRCTSSWSACRSSCPLLIATLVVVFAIKFRRRHADDVGAQVHGGLVLELAWTVVPVPHHAGDLFLGREGLLRHGQPARRDAEHLRRRQAVDVEGPAHDGQREINELHVPVGRPVKLIMTSEDVIHDFSIPAFRVKADVIPGRFVQIWFEPTRPGTYHLFCAEYCGTQHSGMIGQVVVMEATAYQDVAERRRGGRVARVDGRKAVRRPGVQHLPPARLARTRAGAAERVRPSRAAAGRQVVTADENYLRESILTPAAKLTAGLSAGDAGVPGTGQRGTAACADRVHQVALDAAGKREPIMAAEFPAHHYLNDGYGIKSWLLTRDHKRIALLYLAASRFSSSSAAPSRCSSGSISPTPAGDLVSDDTYNQLFTMHGIVMVFFFLIPAIPADPRQLSRAADDRREGPRVSKAESVELVHLHRSAG